MRRKKGSFFFILDVFIGSFIFIVTLLLILSFKLSYVDTNTLNNKLDGFTNVLFKNQVNSYINAYKEELKENPETWPSSLLTTDELIYYLYESGYEEEASLLVQNLSSVLLPNHIGINYTIDGEEVYSRLGNKKENSLISFSNKKITYMVINSKDFFDPVITEVAVWQ